MVTRRSQGRNRKFYIETFRPAFNLHRGGTDAKTCMRVHDGGPGFSSDECSPSMTSLWHVHGVLNQTEAIALVLESAAGMDVPNVRQIVGHVKSYSTLPPEG